jgi:Dolichyl-phosphate-mannose-protein mannosyltransferase
MSSPVVSTRQSANEPAASLRLVPALLLAVLACEFVSLVLAARQKLLWDDELITLYVSSLRPFSQILRALRAGADGMPPAYYGLIVLVQKLPGDPHVLLRLPSIVGFLLSLLGVYWFVRKRYSAVAALSAVLILSLLPFREYAIEARSYALMVGLLAVSAALWQRVDERWWARPLLACCLMLAVAAHHFAVVALAGFGMAELAFSWASQRLRWSVWAALLIATLVFLTELPLLAGIRAVLGRHYWAKIAWSTALTTYGDIFNGNSNLALVGVLLFGLTVAGMLFRWWHDPGRTRFESSFSFPDFLLIGGFLILPAILVVLAQVSGAGYTTRYGWPAILGLALGSVFLTGDIWTKPAGSRVLAALLLVFLFQTTENFRILLYGQRTNPEDRWSEITRLSVENPTIPVAIDAGNAYLQLLYYSAPELRKQVIRVIDPEAALRWGGTDNSELIHRLLGQFFPWRLEDSVNFLAAHKKFMVLSDGSNFTVFSWLPQYLLEKKYHLTLLWKDGPGSIFLAEESSLSGF